MCAKKPPLIHIYGIRHHGPGSAKSLLRVLQQQQPDIILIECPQDTEILLPYTANPALQPPVAMLVYHPKNLQQASFLPFANYSPEWQAIQYGMKQEIPIRCMDLPVGTSFGMQETDDATSKISPDDPFTAIARLAGYSDAERWWEALFERKGEHDAQQVFEVVMELMQALRAEKKQAESRETIVREAFMRQCIRQAEKDGFQSIAIVCGAWHGPVLKDYKKTKAIDDTALLKNLKKVKTACTWIPWTYDRLSTQSGYGAGVHAPYWYHVLFQENSRNPAVVWLSEAARCLRERDVLTSSAHIIEAARLADALAILRKTALPGIDELRESAVAVLGEGREGMLELIEKEIIIGDIMGQVPANLPIPPIKADYDALVKSCRLERSSTQKNLELDLRENADLKKSIFLHRSALLGIPWGQTIEIGKGKQGRFHEHWRLKWLPDYEIRIIEAGSLGNTVEAAVTQLLYEKTRDAFHLAQLTALMEQALKAEIGPIIPMIIQRISVSGSMHTDALLLAEALPPLANAYRYGQARKIDTDLIMNLLEQIIPRFCLQLPAACVGINSDVAADVMQKILAANRAINILKRDDFTNSWAFSIREISQSLHAAPLLSGMATRLLFDTRSFDAAQTATAMRYHLSKAQYPLAMAEWFEGFLHGSGLLLLHHPELWHILDAWILQVDNEDFQEILPLLRRTFSRFHPAERGKMMDLAKYGIQQTPLEKNMPQIDPEAPRLQPVNQLLKLIFET